MASNLITAIDIGSSTVRVATAERLKGGQIRVLAMAKSESRGIRYGHVVNTKEAIESLREAISKIENSLGQKIRNASISVNGVALDNTILASSVAISRADGEITDLDIERALGDAETKISEQSNVRIIHSIPIDYKVDGKKILGKPQGMQAGKIEVKTLFVTASDSHLKKLVKVVESVGIEVEDVFAGPIAESLVTASNLQKNAGCVIVNIGSATVSMIVYEENLPRVLTVFKIGGDDITNDIALGLKIPIEEAELIKLGQLPSNNQRLSQKKIQDMVEARLKDIFEIVDGQLKKIHRSELLPAGVIITGGTANTEKISELAKKHLGLPAVIGSGTDKKLVSPSSLPESSQRELMQARVNYDAIREPAWSVTYGLLVLTSQLDEGSNISLKFIKHTKNKVWEWFKQFLP